MKHRVSVCLHCSVSTRSCSTVCVSINAAFKRARESYGYNGDYFLVYPIKVNQHRRVIESLIHSGEPLGLEAGSKAELMAVLAHAGMTRSVIVCNGYKDREYIRLALIGEKMGHKVYLVIEVSKSPLCWMKQNV